MHGERAQCELHHNGPVVPIGNHRQDVPSVRLGGRDDAHLQDVDLRPDKGAGQLPASREETFQASFEVGKRTPGPSAAAPGAVAGSTNVGSRSSSLARSTRTDPLLVFAAVKKMAPSSREAVGPEVPDDACPLIASVATCRADGATKFPMHAVLFAAGVPRMRLCQFGLLYCKKYGPSSNTSEDV